MARNPLLLYALLSMDAYHRGADGGLNLLLRDKSTEIDGTIRQDPESNDKGFSALAYKDGTATIIAYRGTDDGGVTQPAGSNDFLYGFPIALGTLTA
jgi:hypothetical protein